MNIIGTIFGAFIGSIIYFSLVCLVFYYRNEFYFTDNTVVGLISDKQRVLNHFKNDIYATVTMKKLMVWLRRNQVLLSVQAFWLNSVVRASIPVIAASLISSFILNRFMNREVTQIVFYILLLAGFIWGHRFITVPFNRAKIYIKQLEEHDLNQKRIFSGKLRPDLDDK